MVLSIISLPGIKELWALDITLGKMDFIRLARHLDIIRDTTLPKLMGWSSVIYYGSFFLGMSTICVNFFFFFFKYLPKCNTDNTVNVTSALQYAKIFGRRKETYHPVPGHLMGAY